MLNHHHCVTRIDQPVQYAQQPLNVGKVETGGRFIQDVERFPGRTAAQLLGELDALGLAAGEGCGRLAQGDVTQAYGV